jgi:hypothetical protein
LKEQGSGTNSCNRSSFTRSQKVVALVNDEFQLTVRAERDKTTDSLWILDQPTSWVGPSYGMGIPLDGLGWRHMNTPRIHPQVNSNAEQQTAHTWHPLGAWTRLELPTMESLRLLLVARPPYLSYIKVTLGWQPAWYLRLRKVKPALSVPCRRPNLGRLCSKYIIPHKL